MPDIDELRETTDLADKLSNLRKQYNKLSAAQKRFSKQLGASMSIKILQKSIAQGSSNISKLLIPSFNMGSRAAIDLSKNIKDLGRTSIDTSYIDNMSDHIQNLRDTVLTLSGSQQQQMYSMISVLQSQRNALIDTADTQIKVNQRLQNVFTSIDKVVSMPLIRNMPFIDTITDKMKVAISKTTFQWATGLKQMQQEGTTRFTKLGKVLQVSLKSAVIAGTAGLAIAVTLATGGIIWIFNKVKELVDLAKGFKQDMLELQKSIALSNDAFKGITVDLQYMSVSKSSIQSIVGNFQKLPDNINNIRQAMDKLNISFGVSTSASVKLYDSLNRISGLNVQTADKFIRQVIANAQDLGLNQKQIIQQLAQIPNSILASFRNSKQQLAQMVLMSKSSGLATSETIDILTKLASPGQAVSLIAQLSTKIAGFNVDVFETISRAQSQDFKVVFDLLKQVSTKYDFNNMFLNKHIQELTGVSTLQLKKIGDLTWQQYVSGQKLKAKQMDYYTQWQQQKQSLKKVLTQIGLKFLPLFNTISSAINIGVIGILEEIQKYINNETINQWGLEINKLLTDGFKWIKDQDWELIINNTMDTIGKVGSLIQRLYQFVIRRWGSKEQKANLRHEDWKRIASSSLQGRELKEALKKKQAKQLSEDDLLGYIWGYWLNMGDARVKAASSAKTQAKQMEQYRATLKHLDYLNTLKPPVIYSPLRSNTQQNNTSLNINNTKVEQLLEELIITVKESNNIYLDSEKVNNVLYNTNKIIRNNI